MRACPGSTCQSVGTNLAGSGEISAERRLVIKGGRTTQQILRYALVGITVNLAGYLVYLLVTWLGVQPKSAMTSLYLLVVIAGFFGNRKLTFAHEGGMLGSGTRYALAHCAGYAINLSALVIFVDILGFPHQLVQACAVFLVAGFLFFAFKFFVFRESC